ncbi:hypothetical protein ACLKA7_014859 [Drosophila subpalustris]
MLIVLNLGINNLAHAEGLKRTLEAAWSQFSCSMGSTCDPQALLAKSELTGSIRFFALLPRIPFNVPHSKHS